MKILLFGKTGQLGWELQRSLAGFGNLIALDYPEVDFLREETVISAILGAKPDLVVNAAAYTDVEGAEKFPEVARKVNGIVPGLIARQALKLRAGLIHFSTDYVFDGLKGSPYSEQDLPNPVNFYGRSKLEGEQLVLAAGGASVILRTSWVYCMRGMGFFNKMLQWSRSQETMRVVDDQIGSPTWARALTVLTQQIVAGCVNEPYESLLSLSGVYHAAGAGIASRFEWAQAILKEDPGKEEQIVTRLIPAKTQEFPSDVQRPPYSALDNTKLSTMKLALPPWRESLGKCLQDHPIK